MDIEVISVECSLHQNSQTCDCVNLEDINQSHLGSGNGTDKENCRENSRASVTRQCFAAMIGEFKLCFLMDTNNVIIRNVLKFFILLCSIPL